MSKSRVCGAARAVEAGTAAASTPSNATGRRTREQILRAARARELKKGASPASSPVANWRECGNVHGDGRIDGDLRRKDGSVSFEVSHTIYRLCKVCASEDCRRFLDRLRKAAAAVASSIGRHISSDPISSFSLQDGPGEVLVVPAAIIGLGCILACKRGEQSNDTQVSQSTAISIPVKPWGSCWAGSSWRSPSPLGPVVFAAASGQLETHELVVAIVGCNIAWGVIDATLFVLNSLFYRSRHARFFRVLKNVTQRGGGLGRSRGGIWAGRRTFGRPPGGSRPPLSILASPERSRHTRPQRACGDRISYLPFIVFALVSATALPGVIPLLLLADSNLALHVSNWVLIVLLFRRRVLVGSLHRRPSLACRADSHAARDVHGPRRRRPGRMRD